MKTEDLNFVASRLTQEETVELRHRVFNFEQERSKAGAPIRYMLIGGVVFAGGVGIFSEVFFPSLQSEINRVLLWGVLGVVAIACYLGRRGKVERNREAHRILEEICERHR